jgi:hypothetical protein
MKLLVSSRILDQLSSFSITNVKLCGADQEMIADSIIDSTMDDQISVTNNIREDNDRFNAGFLQY